MLKKVAPFIIGSTGLALLGFYNIQRTNVFDPHKQVYDEIKENGLKYKFTSKLNGNTDILSLKAFETQGSKRILRYITHASRHIAYNGNQFDISNIQKYIEYLKGLKSNLKIEGNSFKCKLCIMDVEIALDYIAKYIADL